MREVSEMWQIQSASVRGSGHFRQGKPCQDRIRILECGGVTAAALSDGAGSAEFSQIGAEIAAQIACQVLCRDFVYFSTEATPYAMRRAILTPVTEAIRAWADGHGVSESALACTLLAVAVQGDRYVIFHVGDGVIGYRKGSSLLVASHPENGEFCNTTTFVTSWDALARCRTLRGSSREIDGFFFLCDGCESALYDKRRGKLAPLCGYMLDRGQHLEASVAQHQLEQVLSGCIAARTQDDCSLVVMTRKTETFKPWGQLPASRRAKILGIRTNNHNRRRRMIRRYARDFGAA